MDQLEGGYLIHRADPILGGINRHTIDMAGRPVSEFDLEATNRLQATPWTVNRTVAGVARHLWINDVACPLVPGSDLLPVPGTYEKSAWEALSEDARKAHRAARGTAHRENTSRLGRRRGFEEALDTATIMEDHAQFWFVWNHDFRLRRYASACGGLNPQGNDLSKNLMHFARGKALGGTGLYWLGIRAANAFGHDKLPLDDRFGWAMDNVPLFERILSDPTDWRLWTILREDGTVSNDPWASLATALEIAMAFKLTSPEDFVSHLAVPCDGTANGLQHLSAMGLDPTGAMATNLCAGVERQDPYLAVLAKAKEIVERDAAQGNPSAVAWYGRMTRDSVKRAVLATPYGISDGGIQRQLLEDGHVPKSDVTTQLQNAAYFRDVLVDSLSGTVVAAKQIMAWLQVCSKRLAEAGQPLEWTTPTGSTLRQAYKARVASRVETLVGRIQLVEEAPGGGLDATKQALGASPQIVHSFDAAHLAATVNRCGALGITDFAMIHDSFGCHAADTATMNVVNRAAFCDQYRPDRLVELAEGFRRYAAHVDIPTPPARGSFDLDANVPNAAFFFS